MHAHEPKKLLTFAPTLEELVAAMLAAYQDLQQYDRKEWPNPLIRPYHYRPTWRIYCGESVATALEASLLRRRLDAAAQEIGFKQTMTWKHENVGLLRKEGFALPCELTDDALSLSRPQPDLMREVPPWQTYTLKKGPRC